jgi:phosphoserine phosphatase
MATERRPILICDLDGTILRVNSFPLWVLYLMFGPLPALGWANRGLLSLRTQRLLLQRKLGRIDHRQLVRGTQSAWHRAAGQTDDIAATGLRSLLLRRVRPPLVPLLHQIKCAEIDAILATAAIGEYAEGLGRDLGFRHIVSSPVWSSRNGDLNAGTRKLASVLGLLTAQNWMQRPLVLLTDHIDDLPLIRHCLAVAWFGSAAGLTRANAAADHAMFINCHGLNETGLAEALASLAAYACSATALSDSTAS